MKDNTMKVSLMALVFICGRMEQLTKELSFEEFVKDLEL